jgi:hypothetical protein
LAWGDVGKVERDDFAAPESCRKADQQQRTVTESWRRIRDPL